MLTIEIGEAQQENVTEGDRKRVEWSLELFSGSKGSPDHSQKLVIRGRGSRKYGQVYGASGNLHKIAIYSMRLSVIPRPQSEGRKVKIGGARQRP